MKERIIIAGSGGQGIMLLGKILAQAALREDKFVTWLPAYGAEVRGGTAHCMVVISDREIGSPHIEKADTLIIMNGPSLTRFGARVERKGLLLVNSSLAKLRPHLAAEAMYFPFSDIALKLGNIKVANMVALGCYLAAKKTIELSSVDWAIRQFTPADKRQLIGINKEALSCGGGLVNGKG
jgi:2-oxoglutarate ferredoxin oxidoreductase subunit gamma